MASVPDSIWHPVKKQTGKTSTFLPESPVDIGVPGMFNACFFLIPGLSSKLTRGVQERRADKSRPSQEISTHCVAAVPGVAHQMLVDFLKDMG